MTTQNQNNQRYLNYAALVQIGNGLYTELQFQIEEARAIPLDVSIDDHIALAKFIDDLNYDLRQITRATCQVMKNCSIEVSDAENMHIDGTDITIAYNRKQTTKKITRRLRIGEVAKEWEELLPPR